MHVRSWRLVVRVPFFVLNDEARRQALHYWMSGRLNRYRSRNEGGNVLCESDSAHETGEPWPHGVAIKFSQQRGVMESDPPAAALLDISLEGCHRRWRPGIGREIEFDKELIMRQKRIVNVFRVVYVVHGKSVNESFVRQPDFRRIDERLVDAALLRDCEHSEFRRRLLCITEGRESPNGNGHYQQRNREEGASPDDFAARFGRTMLSH